MAEKIVIERESTPSGFLLDDIDTSDGPTYEPAEVAKTFFGLSSHWIRWRESQGHLEYKGRIVGQRTPKGSRYYTLSDIEEMVYALLDHQALSAPLRAR